MSTPEKAPETVDTTRSKPTEGPVSAEATREGQVRQVDQNLARLEERQRSAQAGRELDAQLSSGAAAATATAGQEGTHAEGSTTGFLSGLSGAWGDAAKWIEESFASISAWLKEKFGFTPDEAKDKAKQAVDAAHDAVDGASSKVKKTAEKAKEWAGEFLDALWPDAPFFSFPKGYSGAVDVSSLRGMRKHPVTGEEKMHHGVDVPAPEGTPIIATTDCIVITSAFQESVDPKTGRKTGAGHYIKVRRPDGVVATMMHLVKAGPPKNTSIKKGQVLGYVGHTGGATGPHIHFEIDTAAGEQDPYPWLASVLQDEARKEGAHFDALG